MSRFSTCIDKHEASNAWVSVLLRPQTRPETHHAKQRRSRRTGQYTDVPNSSLPLLLLVALTRAPCAPSSSSLQSQTPAPLNHRLRVVGMYGSAHTCTCVRVPLRKQTRAHNFIPACTETLCQDSGFAQCLPLRIKNLPRITIKGDKTSVGDFGIY